MLHKYYGFKKGEGGGGSGGTKESPNTLVSTSAVKFLHAICEGECEGPVNGLESIYINGTPLFSGSKETFDVEVTWNEAHDTDPTKFKRNFDLVQQNAEGLALLSKIKVGQIISGPNIQTNTFVTYVHLETPYYFSVDKHPIGNPQIPTDPVGGTVTVYDGMHSNFGSFALSWRNGTVDQSPIEGIDMIETQITGIPENEITVSVPVSFSVTDPEIDFVRVSLTTPQMTYQHIDTTTGTVYVEGSVVNYQILVKAYDSPDFVSAAERSIDGKCVSPYVVSETIPVKNYGSGPWEIKVVRHTPMPTDGTVQNKIYVHSAFALYSARLNYPHTSLCGGVIDAKQFSSLPKIAYHMDLLRVKVPRNYNPLTREYATEGPGTIHGVWDGTFKIAWTDNPVWCTHDLLLAKRYGFGQYVKETQLDKFKLYDMAKWCDRMVPDGYGGMEPNVTLNIFLETREAALKVLTHFAGVFNSLIYWAGNQIGFSTDSTAVEYGTILCPSNVIDGLFVYSGVEEDSKHTVAIVSWNDPDDFSKLKYEYVDEPDAVREYGIIETEVAGFGCASRGQARRIGRNILFTELYESEAVSFSMSLDGGLLLPGMIVPIFDPSRVQERTAGRIVEYSNTTGFRLDAPIKMEAGLSYSVLLISPSGQVVSRPLVNIPNPVTLDVVYAIPLPPSDVPPLGEVWAVVSSAKSPELWRVMSIEEGSLDSTYKIGAIRYRPEKRAWVEENIPFTDKPSTDFPSSEVVLPPTNVSARCEIAQHAEGIERKILVHWSNSEDRFLSHYEVEYRSQKDNWVSLGKTPSVTLAFGVKIPSTYSIRVRAVNLLNKVSQWVLTAIDVTKEFGDGGSITNLRLSGSIPSPVDIFEGQSATIEWDYDRAGFLTGDLAAGSSPLVDYFVVKVENMESGSPVELYTTQTKDRRFVLSHEDNFLHTNGDPTRKLRVSVAAKEVDRATQLTAFSSILIGNPAPLLGVNPPVIDTSMVSIVSVTDQLVFKYFKPNDTDFGGIAIWISQSPTFSVSDICPANGAAPYAAAMVPFNPQTNEGMLLYKGWDTVIPLPLPAGTNYKIIFAPYDDFGLSDLNYYGPVAAAVTAQAGAKLVSVNVSSQIFKVVNSTATPSSIDISAVGQNVSGMPSFSVSLGSATLTGSGYVRSLPFANMSSDVVTIDVVWDGATDKVTLVKLQDGKDSITALLTNESHSLGADYAGNVSSYAGASTTLLVFFGTTDDSSNWSCSAQASSGVGGYLVGKTYTVNSMSVDAGYVDLTITRSGYPSITKRFSLLRTRAGVPGNNGTSGLSTKLMYRRDYNQPGTPTGNSPSGWTDTPETSSPAPLWMISGRFDSNLNIVGSWTTPCRLSGGMSYVQPNQPSGSIFVNDVWIDTSTLKNEIKVWNGTTWELRSPDAFEVLNGVLVVKQAAISRVAAGAIQAGDITTVNLAVDGRLFHSSFSQNKFGRTEMGVIANHSKNWGSGSSWTFSHDTGLLFGGPGASTPGAPRYNVDADGNATFLLLGHIRGYAGILTIYTEKNNGGNASIAPQAAMSSDDAGNATILAIRKIPIASLTDFFKFYIAPCDSSGNLQAAAVNQTYTTDLTVMAFN